MSCSQNPGQIVTTVAPSNSKYLGNCHSIEKLKGKMCFDREANLKPDVNKADYYLKSEVIHEVINLLAGLLTYAVGRAGSLYREPHMIHRHAFVLTGNMCNMNSACAFIMPPQVDVSSFNKKKQESGARLIPPPHHWSR